MKRYTLPLLLACNLVLLLMGWILALVAYPRLPARIAFWPPLVGGDALWAAKTPLFLLLPFLQVVVFSGLFALAQRHVRRFNRPARIPVFREYVFLTLIFVNLIFIHLQRYLIEISHGVDQGGQTWYFLGLLAVIGMLIPYYRIRLKLAGL
jgi:hypothetical protein